jgi:hypothetical protein
MRVILMVCLTLLALALPATAQDDILGLSGDDIATLETANNNSFDTDQFAFNYSVSTTVEFDGQTIDVALSGEGALDVANVTAFITLNGEAGGLPLEGEVRLIGETLYGRATDPTSGEDTDWIGIDLDGIDEANLDFESLGEDFTSEVIGDSDVNTDALLSALFAFTAVDPSAYLSASRTDDGASATYTLNLSLRDLFRADGMTEVTVAFAESVSDPLTTVEASGVNGILAEVFAETVIAVEQVVDTENAVVGGASIFVSSFVDPQSFGETGEPVNVVFALDVSVFDYGVAVEVEKPDAPTLPFTIITDAIGLEPLDEAGESGSAAPSGESQVVDLSCDTNIYAQGYAVGTTLNGTCPAGCDGAIWGTDIYSDDSSICTAAIHAGVIPASGGEVTIMVEEGQDSYTASDRNGIQSFDFGAWEGSYVFVGGGTADGGVKADTPSTDMANSYSFPTGLTFGYSDSYEIQTDSDVVTVIWTPNAPNFIQVYDMGSLFGGMDMGRDFFKDTYGSSAASTWNFPYDKNNFEEVQIDGKQYSVLDFEGESASGPTVGRVVIVPLDEGGFTYVQSYSTTTPPDTFLDDTLAVATSISG